MNKNIKLAVAGAVLALSASANAGIIIPAGDWTLDIGGIVNTYATWTKTSGDTYRGSAPLGIENENGNRTQQNMTTGLLPNYLSVSGTTRQNDLDVAFTISINPGSSTTGAGKQTSHQENRQAFLTFGDKSWGSIKLGKDLGVFASDAILNDMTLLGVGAGAGGLAGNTTTLGRIGTGFMYADWKAQIAYTTPNFNGFQATVAMTQAWNATDYLGWPVLGADTNGRGGASPAFEGKASYTYAVNDVTGKVWVSGISQKLKDVQASSSSGSSVTAWAADIGASANVAGFGLTGYYYAGEGIGQTLQFFNGLSHENGKKRDSDGGYIQATYVLPTKTKIGVSWGQSNLNGVDGDEDGFRKLKDSMTTVGAYHPLTKHLNLVAEYSQTIHTIENEWYNNTEGRARTVSLGGILFF
jgi:predicted porin